MNEQVTGRPFEVEFPLFWIEAGTLKNLGFDRHTNDGGDIGAYVRRAEQFPPFRVVMYMQPMVVEEAVPVDYIDFFITDPSLSGRIPYNVREWLRFLEDQVQEKPVLTCAWEKRRVLEIPLSTVAGWVECHSFSKFERFKDADRPVESFLGHLENNLPLELAHALKPMVVDEGVHPEEIELRVVDGEGRRYSFRPRPGWVGHILRI